jgi:hypothetical protein
MAGRAPTPQGRKLGNINNMPNRRYLSSINFSGPFARWSHFYVSIDWTIAHLFGRTNRFAIGENADKRKRRSDFLKTVLDLKASLESKLDARPNPNTGLNFSISLNNSRGAGHSSTSEDHNESADTALEDERDRTHSSTPSSRHPNIVRPKDIIAWNLKFTGGNELSVAAFLERVDDLCLAYQVEKSSLLPKALFLFDGKALVWYTANKHTFDT